MRKNSWSSSRQPWSEKRRDTHLGPLSTRPLFSRTRVPVDGTRFLWCGWSSMSVQDLCSRPCPMLQPRSSVWANRQQPLWQRGHSFALADYRVHGSTREHENTFLFYTHVIFKSVYHFFSINSDSYHLLTLGPSPTAQIRTMVLGAETYTFSSCYYFWYFSSRHTRTNFLKELLQFPIVARKFVATHSVWKHGLFMPLTRYQKHPFHQPKVWGKLPT